MAISKEKYLQLFLDEFRENLLSAENQIILLKNDQENVDALATLLRTLHTIKGSSRMLQLGSIEKLIHGMETVFKGVRDGRYPVDARLVRFFFLMADRLRLSADTVEKGGLDTVDDLDDILVACEKLSANEAFDLSSISRLNQEPQPAGAEPSTVQAVALPPVEATRAEEPVSAAPVQLESSIRVDSKTIDQSISLVNTLTIRQLRMRAAADQLDSLEKRLTSSYHNAGDLKAVRKELAGMARAIRQYRAQYSDQLFEIEHGTQELRDAVIGMRMLPLSVVLERFPRMVEETAASLGKDVGITITGDSVRLDRTVLARLSDPLIHLVRNSLDHGIETPEKRQKAGKPVRGTIRIECKTEGSRISVVVSDDGGGLDYPAIRAKAIALRPENEADIARMPDESLAHFLFQPGFTTRSTSSALSGRGIGLDIVKTNIEAAKGQIHLDSVTGEGSRFTLLVPVSSSTMDGMFVLCSGLKFFIPATTLGRTLLIDQAECFSIHQKELFKLDGVNIQLSELATALQLEQKERKGDKLPVLLVRGASETVGLAVERILGYDSLVYQALPPGLRKNPLVQGVVFDTSFNIVPILNMWAILDRLRSVRAMDTHRRFQASGAQEKPAILVVDDSVSTREIEISMLELEGYEVVGAVDGVDALEKLRESRFDLVVSDLHMPRMDGLQLLENIRNDEAIKSVRFVFVTTVDDPLTRQQAATLGADKYILKSSFEQDDLVDSVRALILEPGASNGR